MENKAESKEWFDDHDEIKAWAVSRISHFLDKLKSGRDSLEIESCLYTIMRTAEHGHNKMNSLNNRRYRHGKV